MKPLTGDLTFIDWDQRVRFTGSRSPKSTVRYANTFRLIPPRISPFPPLRICLIKLEIFCDCDAIILAIVIAMLICSQSLQFANQPKHTKTELLVLAHKTQSRFDEVFADHLENDEERT